MTAKKETARPADLSRFFIDWLEVELNLAPNTVLAYRRDLARYLAFLENKGLSPLDAQTTDVIDFLGYEREGGDGRKPKAASTVGRALAAVKTFYRFLLLDEFISYDIVSSIEAPKKSYSLPQILNQDELNRILEAPDTTTKLGLRDKALLETMFSTGGRASEVTGLLLANVNLTEGHCFCVGKGGKERILFLGIPAIEAMENYLKLCRPGLVRPHTKTWVFLSQTGRQLSRHSLWCLVKKYAKIAKIEKRVYPHIFRHCFATSLLRNGADLRSIQELLSHSQISTTQIYTRVVQSDLVTMHHKYHPRG